MSKNETNESKVTGFSPQHILVPVDGSQNSKRAIEVALKIAQTYGSSLDIINVVPIQRFVVESAIGFGGAPPDYYQFAEEDAKKIVGEAENFVKGKGYSNVKGETIRGSESVVQAIVEFAEQEHADLIVIGTRGLGGFKKMLVGSVSSGVVTHAHCNVVVVR